MNDLLGQSGGIEDESQRWVERCLRLRRENTEMRAVLQEVADDLLFNRRPSKETLVRIEQYLAAQEFAK